jgi:hypothetical protein
MIVVGFVILAWLLTGCVLLYLDVEEQCRYRQLDDIRDELLDQLWEDE